MRRRRGMKVVPSFCVRPSMQIFASTGTANVVRGRTVATPTPSTSSFRVRKVYFSECAGVRCRAWFAVYDVSAVRGKPLDSFVVFLCVEYLFVASGAGKFTVEEIAALRQAASSSTAALAPSPYGQYYVAVRDPAGGVYGQPAVVTAPVVAANRPSSGGGEEAAAVYAAYAGYSPSSYASAASAGPSAGSSSSTSVSARHTDLYFPAASSSSSSASGSGGGGGGNTYHHVQHPAGSSSDPGERTVMLPTSRRLCNFWPVRRKNTGVHLRNVGLSRGEGVSGGRVSQSAVVYLLMSRQRRRFVLFRALFCFSSGKSA